MNAVVEIIKALTPFITAATPVLLILVNWWVTHNQTKKLQAHSDDNKEQIKAAVVSSGTTTQKILSDAR
jgi:hypothetical protein